MKYLGLVLDSRWNFREHFVRLTPRLMAASAALKRLMPNIGGPELASRRLYMGVERLLGIWSGGPSVSVRVAQGPPAPGVPSCAQGIGVQKLLVRQSIVLQWEEELAGREEGHRTVEAVRPVLQDWLERERGSLTFRLVQVLTGHGCFGSYLHRFAKREVTAECHQCSCAEDTAQHTGGMPSLGGAAPRPRGCGGGRPLLASRS
ncbi:uncharacterized protein LOC133534051 [Cydia pomonella]|uniref:uncharacterized protein LOC133534051 n=1 Tax=Cydia pomonella TaxID=82600 RepID=UPI002ADD730C|nr:uncharacterized protein LOC133534051 [Cydia pomonella]